MSLLPCSGFTSLLLNVKLRTFGMPSNTVTFIGSLDSYLNRKQNIIKTSTLKVFYREFDMIYYILKILFENYNVYIPPRNGINRISSWKQ